MTWKISNQIDTKHFLRELILRQLLLNGDTYKMNDGDVDG